MQVNSTGDVRRRMPEECLHCAQRCADRIEQSCVRVPQPMPAHVLQSQLLARWLELPIDEIVPVKRCSRFRAEHQSVGIHASWLRADKISIAFAPKGTDRLLR